MKTFLLLLIICLLISITESNRRRRSNARRDHDRYNHGNGNGYGYVQQYSNQYGLYGPGGQGWVNTYNDRYPNQNIAWNNNFNWNQGHRRPEWYYNTAKATQPSVLCLLVFGLFYLCI